eukprot:SAG31_NODE_24770_length_474_cov_1.021333_1_plen_45_part_10
MNIIKVHTRGMTKFRSLPALPYLSTAVLPAANITHFVRTLHSVKI